MATAIVQINFKSSLRRKTVVFFSPGKTWLDIGAQGAALASHLESRMSVAARQARLDKWPVAPTDFCSPIEGGLAEDRKNEMKSILVERKIKNSLLDQLMKVLFLRYVRKKAKALNEVRGAPIAVFGNDWIGANIFVDGIYEREFIEDLYMALDAIGVKTKEGYALDVGANIGNHSIQFSRNFKGVLSFEPNPRTFEVLSLNTKRIRNIECLNIGLGSKREHIKLYEDPQNFGGSSTVYTHEGEMSVDIEVRPLDDFIEEFTPISLIKIDVEGMEYEVLTGAQRILKQHKPVVFFEQLATEFEINCNETKSIDYLRSEGFKIFHLQTCSVSGTKICRKVTNALQPYFGITQTRRIVAPEKIPKATYNMLIAVHTDRL